ncbi:MAG: NTP transferase domain-containing protein [Anaerolineales bacterium]
MPAAGNASRWKGFPKECLPASNGETFLSRTVESLKMCGCDVVLVISHASKIQLHAYLLKDQEGVLFALQQGEEIWAAFTTALKTPADEYCFLMPDTYVPDSPFPTRFDKDFGIGFFQTWEPERFGVLRDGQIVDKQPGDVPCQAWGVLAWKKPVADLWKHQTFPCHTDAINAAIMKFDFDSWILDYYCDIGSMEFYIDFLLKSYAEGEDANPGIAAD